MIQSTYTPNSEAIAQVEALAWEGVQRAAVHLWTALQRELNVPNSGVRQGGRTVYPNPSLPGQPPRKRTGWLQRNVQYELDRATQTARVGVAVNARYGLFLEMGTRRMAARPWLLATLQKEMARIRELTGGGA